MPNTAIMSASSIPPLPMMAAKATELAKAHLNAPTAVIPYVLMVDPFLSER